MNEIRKHAKEIIDEEIAGSIGSSIVVGEATATFYLARVNTSKNIFRVGLIKDGKNFLGTNEFKSMVIDLYNHFDTNFFYECEVIQSNEFTHIDDEALEKMKEILDGNIKRLKTLNRYIFDTEGFHRTSEYDPRRNGKYDLRTLPFKEYKESFPIQIYNSSLSLLEPIAKACLDKNTGLMEKVGCGKNTNLEESSRLDAIKKMGI